MNDEFTGDWKNAKYNRFAIQALLNERDAIKADRDRLLEAIRNYVDANESNQADIAAAYDALVEALASRSPSKGDSND